MHAPATKILLGTTSYKEAPAHKRKLEEHAIDIALVHNEQTCGGGCGVKLEIWSNTADAEAIGRILAADRDAEITRMGHDPAVAAAVFDTSRAEATCPACGTGFSTALAECPECGLCFGIPEDAPKKGCGTC